VENPQSQILTKQLNTMKTIKKQLSNKLKTIDPVATIEITTKVGIAIVIGILLGIIFYNGVILQGFSSGSWGL